MRDSHSPPPGERLQRLWEVAKLFLKLGFTAFGGPAAHIAMMHEEVVEQRGWVDNQHFLDMLGATNLIPGPNSTEMSIHLGFTWAGWAGLIVGGVCFAGPATLMVLALAWAYVRFGATPIAGWLLYGIKPVIIAIILQAVWSLGRRAVKGWLTGSIGPAVLVLYFLGADPLLLLLGGGLLVMLLGNLRRLRAAGKLTLVAPLAGLSGLSLSALMGEAVPISLGVLFLTFLKVGFVMYGSGYTLLAFMQDDFVNRLGWLSNQQLIDAIAIGQFTPGPVSTTATFVGYVLAGVPGAIVATVGMFLPSFLLVAFTNPLIPRLRRSPWAGGFLDGVNVAALGLMAAVTLQLARAAFVDPLTIAVGLIAAGLLLRFRVNTTWLIFGGALVGGLSALLR
ncbi:MAG TPA: chromate efflux transporter [Chloroflexi bacterium]|nr:chromate efflux transporter [Chloroflexota bacterium]